MPRSRSSRGGSKNNASGDEGEEDLEDVDVLEDVDGNAPMPSLSQLEFCSQAPELSQAMQPVKYSERQNLDKLADSEKETTIVGLSRLILFKALAQEPIDRLKVVKEASSLLSTTSNARMTSALLQEVKCNLRNVFGLELRHIPHFMEATVANKYKDRLYVVNELVVADEHDEAEDNDNTQNMALFGKALHSVHVGSSMERGLLMTILALAFCKGEPRSDGSRWILDADLYRLLHSLDDSLPAEPPAAANRKSSSGGGGADHYRIAASLEEGQTPPIDKLLDKFVHVDYLLKEKASDQTPTAGSQAILDDGSVYYSMGPRAAMEIGRRQVIYFCANVLDEAEPDPTMLQELDDAEDDEDEYEEE